jgi:hypothetical protein
MATPADLSLPIAVAMPAFADDPPATTPPSTEIAAVPEPAEPTATTAPPLQDSGATPVDEPTAPRFPRSVIARPLTLPSHLAMLGADATANHDFSAMGAAPILGYGITDKLEVQVPYSFATRELEARGSVGVDVGYVIVRGALDGKLEAIARVRGGYNSLDSVATPLMLGVHAQYNVTPKIAIISGVPGTQQIRISLADDANMAKPADISLPLGIGVQPTDELYLQLDTKLVQLNLSDSANAVIGKDMTPVALTVVYNVINALDVQAALGTDLSNSPGDALSFLVGARYYAGQL